MNTTITSKRLSAVLAFIVAFAVAAVMAISPAAFAKDKVGNINIDTTKKGSIIIHKYSAPAFKGDANGLAQDNAPVEQERKIAGVKFKVTPITGINLTTAAGWEGIKTLSYDGTTLTGPAGAALGAAKPVQTTNQDGETTFSDLPVGVYLVEETEAPESVTKKVDPFFVTIPFPTDGKDATNAQPGVENGWLYDVNVYPKNEITNKLSKELDEAATTATTVGSDLAWKITVPVPSTEKAIATFKVTDTLKNGTVVSADPAHKPIVKLNGQVLTAGDNLQAATTDYKVTGEGTADFAIEFSNAGLNKINAKKGKNIEITLFATVKSALDANKVVNDEVHRIYELAKKPFDPTDPFDPTQPPGEDPKNPKDPNTPPIDDPYVPPTDGGGQPVPPTAYFGDYNLHKVSSVGAVNLKGAKFNVYKSAADAEANGGKGQNPILTNVTSDDNGLVKIKDLYIGKNPTSKVYYVREVEQPAGFKLLATTIVITVTTTTGQDDTADGDPAVNEPLTTGDVPNLPMTGAAGKVLLTLGGIAIVMLAAGTVLATRRRKA